jgi:triacylglycerol lipase
MTLSEVILMDEKQTNNESFIFWGGFVEVAYEMYSQDPVSPSTLPDFPSGWERIANLKMTPRFESFKQTEFAGYIARSLDNPLLQAVIFRGTESGLDWLSDFEFILETFEEVPNGGKTESGFSNLYRSITVEYDDPSIPTQSLISQLDRLTAGTKIVVSGHSLGSSLATLHAFVAGSKHIDVELVTFASPRVGDHEFVEAFQKMNIKNTRIFNNPDIVPNVPLEILGYRHIDPSFEINSALFPIKHSIPCYHALSTYLYILGFDQADIGNCKSSC